MAFDAGIAWRAASFLMLGWMAVFFARTLRTGQEALIILLLVVVLVILFGSGFFALLRERFRRGRDGDDGCRACSCRHGTGGGYGPRRPP